MLETVSAASVIATEFILLVGSWTEEGEVLSPIPEGSWSILRLLLNLRLCVFLEQEKKEKRYTKIRYSKSMIAG